MIGVTNLKYSGAYLYKSQRKTEISENFYFALKKQIITFQVWIKPDCELIGARQIFRREFKKTRKLMY